ncbi:MAG: hypothetical protein R3C11_11470 [Planctomycetaceae bacterium]
MSQDDKLPSDQQQQVEQPVSDLSYCQGVATGLEALEGTIERKPATSGIQPFAFIVPAAGWNRSKC